MKILFTGASSFTGFWFVRALSHSGHKLVCPLSGPASRYAGIRKRRFEALLSVCKTIPEAPFGTEAFLKLIPSEGPFDLLCHHAADVTNYRSSQFDPYGALRNNTLGLQTVLAKLKDAGCRGVVLTGTVFESDEGSGTEPLRAFSPYGLSKTLTSQVFRYYCGAAGVPLGKFVIPNPFGPLEEERFTAYLCRNWREGKTPAVKTPDYTRDNIPVDLLAAVYASFCERMVAESATFSKINPSGYVETQGAFAQRVAREVGARTNWACGLDLQKQTDFSEPMVRVNSDPAAPLVPEWSESAFWDQFASFCQA